MQGYEKLVQAYGAREFATGVAILTSHDPTPWIYGRVAGDGLDLATLAAGHSHSGQQVAGRAMATVAVAGATMLDVVCARSLTAEKQLSSPGTFDYGDRSGFQAPAATMLGAASDFKAPSDFRIPGPLRPWRSSDTDDVC